MAFRLQAQCVHLTYKGWLDQKQWSDHFYPQHGEPKLFSFVHETGDEEHDYDHTHICVEWRKNFDSTNPRVYDFDCVHPHIKKVQSLKHKRTIVIKYHWKKPKGPVQLEDGGTIPYQIGCDEWLLQQEAWDIVEDAPTLKEACQAVGLYPTTIADAERIRKDSAKRKCTALADNVDVKRFKQLKWDRTKALVLRGPPAIGKTQWALSQFKHPVMIEDIDELHNLPDGCDGLVFDEVQFDMLPKAKKIALTDWEMDRTVRIRHTTARIPRHTPKIFCCNEHEHSIGIDSHSSVLRRIQTMDVTSDDLLLGPIFKFSDLIQ